MVGYVINSGCETIFDPAVGAGAFLRAAKTAASELRRRIKLAGTEIDPDALKEARQNGLSEKDLAHVEITDFVMRPPRRTFKAIVANPPYIRHHRLPSRLKAKLRSFSADLIGSPIDGRAGLHVFFLLRGLQLLDEDGRLAFIMPADTCEGVFSPKLWSWITKHYLLEAVVTFAPDASPFKGVDTNPVIFMLRSSKPQSHFLWAKCTKPETNALKSWMLSDFDTVPSDALSVHRRRLSEGLATGLSRPPDKEESSEFTLAQFANVMRGIATGANDFFFLAVKQAVDLGIPDEFLVRAIGRTRDVPGNEIDSKVLRELEAKGRPTLLFSPDGRPPSGFPRAVRRYLERGKSMGIHKRTLIATRHPWYKMEVRSVPPILFAYLGRRNARFVRNKAGVVPLTGFLCVYPHRKEKAFIDSLWEVLGHPETVANLALVGKSYGGGAIKVEPRSLEKLRLPSRIVSSVGLKSMQLPLF